MSKMIRSMVFLFTAACLTAQAATYTWDNETTDNQWTTSNNWVNNSGLPGRLDTVVFNNTQTGLCQIVTNTHVATVFVTNSSGTVDFIIPTNFSLTAQFLQGYNMSGSNSVLMSGGGTFMPTNDLMVMHKTTASVYVTNSGVMAISNIIFDSSQLGNLYVGYNSHTIGSITGVLDLTQATLRWKGNTNMLFVKGNLFVGPSYGQGYLALPNTLTNLTVGGAAMKMGCTVGNPSLFPRPGRGGFHWGNNPAIQTLVVSNMLAMGPGVYLYQIDGVTRTGFPANLEIVVGSPAKPGQLLVGDTYDQTISFRLGDIRALRTWINQLWICRVRNNGAYSCYAELDLTTNSVPTIEGSINAQSVNVGEIAIGGTAGSGQGVLRLPGTVTNIQCNTFEMGNQAGLSDPGNSMISFGTNIQPVTMTVVSNFIVGHAVFAYEDPLAVTNIGFPPASKLRIGNTSVRAPVEIGAIKQGTTSSLFGKGLSEMTMYASNVIMGRVGATGHKHYVTNDFRQASQFMWNVQGDILVGTNQSDFVFLYLPPNGTVTCSNMTIGMDGISNTAQRAYLSLSNTILAASSAVTIRETAAVTNYVDGTSSGFDLGTTALDLQDPRNWTGFPDYGRMSIRFLRDPVNPYAAYWGLRMKGNGVSVIQALTNTSPQRLTWSTNGLSASAQARFGIIYDSARNVTYVGVQPIPSGSLILIR